MHMQSELILLTLYCGGDYNQVSLVVYWSESDATTYAPLQTGLSSRGLKITSWLARYSLGESLVITAHHKSVVGFCKFLTKWCNDLHNILACDPAGLLGQKYPRLTEVVPNDFPDINVLVQYVGPLTSWSNMDRREYQLPVSVVQSHQADYVCFAAICEAHFKWSSATIQAKFQPDLWEGACMRALCQVIPHPVFFTTIRLSFNHKP